MRACDTMLPLVNDLLDTSAVETGRLVLEFSTPGSPVTIRVRTRGAFVEVMVSDRGPGIPPADLPKLFTDLGKGTMAGPPAS